MLLTHIHPDHSGSARELARIWDLPVWVHPGELPMVSGKYNPEYGNPLDRWLIVPLMRVPPRRRVDSMIAAAGLTDVARPLDPVGPPPACRTGDASPPRVTRRDMSRSSAPATGCSSPATRS
jgi:hypothetical protein